MDSRIVPKPWFESWRSPRDFFLQADECMAQFRADEILAMTGVQHLFDAYVAGLFARVWNDHKSCEVRLVSDNFPDAQLRDDTQALDLELTMADRKDRRMAEEHRRLRMQREGGEVRALPIEKDRDRVYAVEAIPRVCRQKVKQYLGQVPSIRMVSVDLLIYVNFATIAGPVLTDCEMVELTKPWQDNFNSIWLISGARIVRTWPSQLAMSALSDPQN